MRRIKQIGMIVMLILLSACTTVKEPEKSMEEFTHITMAELDEKIKNQETMLVYVAWTKNSEDSINLQDNYLLKKTEEFPKMRDLLILDLDQELPSAFQKAEDRSILKEKYDLDSFPSFLYYQSGRMIQMLSWTEAVSDKYTGIYQQILDDYFISAGYLQ